MEIQKLLQCTQNGESNLTSLMHCSCLMGQQNIRNCKLMDFCQFQETLDGYWHFTI